MPAFPRHTQNLGASRRKAGSRYRRAASARSRCICGGNWRGFGSCSSAVRRNSTRPSPPQLIDSNCPFLGCARAPHVYVAPLSAGSIHNLPAYSPFGLPVHLPRAHGSIHRNRSRLEGFGLGKKKWGASKHLTFFTFPNLKRGLYSVVICTSSDLSPVARSTVSKLPTPGA